MKLRFLILGLILGLSFIACSDDDDNFKPDEAVTRAFEEKYPGITPWGWERKNGYVVAEFKENNVEKEAWFDAAGKWLMTESDIRFEDLPQAVITAFGAGEYAQWKIDDVDQLEREGMATVYVIEVENGKLEFDLYYAEDGTLVKAVEDTGDSEHLPATGLPQAMKEYIENHYAGATIIEYETENGVTEVDIYHQNKYKEVKFDRQGQWLSTEWDVLETEVPAVVMNTIRTQYAAYRIDDIDYIERAAEDPLYIFELEKGEEEIHVRVNESGTIIR